MKNLMIDIETVGTNTDAAILSIGYCPFEPSGGTGLIGPAYEIGVVLQSCLDVGLTVDGSTIGWWMQQEQKARTAAFHSEDAEYISLALAELRQVITKDTLVWAKNAVFDFSILTTAYRKACSSEPPWYYRNTRCLYTLRQAAEILGVGHRPDQPEFPSLQFAHIAMHDAYTQALEANYYLQALAKIKHQCE